MAVGSRMDDWGQKRNSEQMMISNGDGHYFGINMGTGQYKVLKQLGYSDIA